VLIETAGGVLSPASRSGTLQADLYRPLRLPGILVGDASLGGISSTLAAYEALRKRGYDVPAIVYGSGPGLERAERNAAAIRAHVDLEETPVVEASLPVISTPAKPDPSVTAEDTHQRQTGLEKAHRLWETLQRWHDQREARWLQMLQESDRMLWWPFTQHQTRLSVTAADTRHPPVLIDSAHGDDYTIVQAKASSSASTGSAAFDAQPGLELQRWFDGCGSWWTQSPGHAHPVINEAIGYALGRYGHVMFPECVHEPAWVLSERLLGSVGEGWASRVFFSDNGSSAMEIALKMAFRVAQKRGVLDASKTIDVRILGLNGSYHGDTLGAMDCSPASTFNRGQTPWYRGRGLFLEAPRCVLRRGQWDPYAPYEHETQTKQQEQERYRWHYASVERELGRHLSETPIGALVLEPVLQGAGGMNLIDPMYQRALIDICRQRGIPIVFDEVFTGFWRLGALTGACILQRQPDIAAYGKLLTGGALPMAVTLASEEVFAAFLGNTRADALLHGHSYSAYPAGCAAANAALALYESLTPAKTRVFDHLLAESVQQLSAKPGVSGVTALGSVLAIHLAPNSDGNEKTSATRTHRLSQIIQYARQQHQVYLRPLGTTIYALTAPAGTPLDRAATVVQALSDALEDVKADAPSDAALDPLTSIV
jgi:dethiobiotin synthetase/adenosylmethionine--8-amino-7-oxononanoate aminotransferase